MKSSFCPKLEEREKADLLILPFWEGGKPAGDFSSLKSFYEGALQDFKAKKGENVVLYVSGQKEPRFLLLGLGKEEKACAEVLRRSYANAARTAVGKKVKTINVGVPQRDFQAIAEGVLLSNYAFDQLKNDSLKENPSVLLEQVHWIGIESSKEIEKIEKICSGVYFVRDLINGNADEITPEALMEKALFLAKESPEIKTTVFDKKWLEREKMGLILAVNQGSSRDPFLLQLAYQGNPGSKEQIVLVGKGITYDTGGLSLKPTDNMLEMKSDMGGAATVLGVIRTVAKLGLKVNVTALVPTTENNIGSRSYKPGDVYRSYSGKTVEITNTDAEGRLVLADALSYAVHQLNPTALIDLATLTGAVVVALGDEIAGLFSSDETLAGELMASSKDTNEMLCHMPLYLDYKESLKSEVADIINAPGREASAMKAALFLHEFTGSTKWAHFDIAGTAFWKKPKYYSPTRATGFGVRLLVDFFEKKASS